MFRFLITITTLAATGMHVLFGCCWHHDHARQEVVCVEQKPTAECEMNVEQMCDCHHACSAESDTKTSQQTYVVPMEERCPCEDQDDPNSSPCEEGHCQYLLNAKVELPSLDSLSGIFALSHAICDTGSLVSDPTGFPCAHRSASLLSGSLCVRDLTQIALI